MTDEYPSAGQPVNPGSHSVGSGDAWSAPSGSGGFGEGLPSYQAPAYPQPPVAAHTTKPAPPSSVRLAFQLLVAKIVVGIIAFAILASGDYYDRMQAAFASSPDISADMAEVFSKGLFLAVGIVGVVASAAVYLLFGAFMRGGASWARMVVTIVGGISLVSTLFGLAAGGSMNDLVGSDVSISTPTSSLLLDGLSAVLLAAAIIAMFVTASNKYFREVRSFRNSQRMGHVG